MKNMEKCERIIQLSMDDTKSINPNIKKVTDNLLLLKETLDASEKEREGYMKKELLRIFPGFFGKYIFFKFSNYLDEPLDSKEKEDAWLHLIKTLDNSPKLKISKELSENIESDDIEQKLIEDAIKHRDKKFSSMNIKDINNYFDYSSNYEFTEADATWCKMLLDYIDSKENIKYTNDLLIYINNDLKILSSRYKTLQKNLAKVDENTKEKFKELSNLKTDRIKKTTGIITLPEMTFIAYEYKKIIPFWKIPELINDFRNRVKEISNVINPSDIYTINGIDSLPQYRKLKSENHRFNFSFIIGVQVSKVEQVPDGMHVFTIPSHKYIWYILKGKRNLNTYIKEEIPLVSFLTQTYKPVKFPLLELYNKDYTGHDEKSIFYNYMPIE
jgi:predicted transcriptional regulator YdeE